jgi:hypothetical protein
VLQCRPKNERGRIEDVAAINCLFAEFDVKDYGSKDAIREHLDTRAVLLPSIVVDSGGGLHCYWLLDEPYILLNEADRKDAGELQARFVLSIGGDRGAKDLARVLRLPDTLNAKYDPPRRVEIIEDNHANAIYTLAELRTWVNAILLRPSFITSESIIPDCTKRAPDGVAGILATVAAQSEGSRNNGLFWGANKLREKAIPHADAAAMLSPIASAIGLPEAEVARTIASAYRGAK